VAASVLDDMLAINGRETRRATCCVRNAWATWATRNAAVTYAHAGDGISCRTRGRTPPYSATSSIDADAYAANVNGGHCAAMSLPLFNVSRSAGSSACDTAVERRLRTGQHIYRHACYICISYATLSRRSLLFRACTVLPPIHLPFRARALMVGCSSNVARHSWRIRGAFWFVTAIT